MSGCAAFWTASVFLLRDDFSAVLTVVRGLETAALVLGREGGSSLFGFSMSGKSVPLSGCAEAESDFGAVASFETDLLPSCGRSSGVAALISASTGFWGATMQGA